ncbi:MAG: ClpXP protease specificity-enhancing factor SspB [Litorimonas sp.]
MSQDLMNYEQMRSLALRGVVRDAIRRVIREDGLPGAHHFYITFLTRYPGVEIDDQLAEKYPEEITIVLEHQFWDLAANSDDFEVTLKFGGIPKYLRVPYHAITRFHDPSVGFSLAFDLPPEMDSAPVLGLAPTASAPTTTALGSPAPTTPALGKLKAEDAPEDPDDTPDGDDEGPKVVSLDAFRKK